jgi:uncharacterized protein (DUF2267 family)
MPTNVRFTYAGAMTSGPSAACGSPAAEARRREIMRLLEDIRSDRPTAREIAEAVRRATDGELAPERVQRIAGSVLALYR